MGRKRDIKLQENTEPELLANVSHRDNQQTDEMCQISEAHGGHIHNKICSHIDDKRKNPKCSQLISDSQQNSKKSDFFCHVKSQKMQKEVSNELTLNTQMAFPDLFQERVACLPFCRFYSVSVRMESRPVGCSASGDVCHLFI